ncbi:uncharacterized protein LOC121386588 [Gigantopelta aegis]|uniref:uncharacterized protein LOC121386588 n=1 Tax=Gigantopelta aegis TaxID=1735272 RepID=UPI001B889C85|nr:uncharacterized protein LOC121386588 [Gigantopelta aegis]
MAAFFLLLVGALMATFSSINSQTSAGYAMYVWTRGFDHTVSGCDLTKFLQWQTSDHNCFTHTWDTAGRRQWLWDTCNLAGREVSRIFLSDVHNKLKQAFQAKSCAGSEVQLVKTAVAEGHQQVTDLKIYALFAVSDLAVTEAELVKQVVWYNDNCAGSDGERFDGVAANNEAYAHIKNADVATRVAYLDKLDAIAVNAATQQQGQLVTHYSMSWHWGIRSDGQNDFTWRGKTQDATRHMIDIFDSTDVQVAFTVYPAISDRMNQAGYAHAVYSNKPIFTTFYTNKAVPCQTSFFPESCTSWHVGTEAAMFGAIDQFGQKGIPLAKPCIHYFRGVYSSGVHPDWPSH